MLTLKRLDINDASKLIAAARAKAYEIGVPMCIAVTDESGNLIAFERMDGAKTTGINLAIDKGFAAGANRKGTHVLGEANQPGKAAHGIASALGGRMVAVGGGLPVFAGEDVVGGIGVSSGTPAQDLEVAQAGVDAFAREKSIREMA